MKNSILMVLATAAVCFHISCKHKQAITEIYGNEFCELHQKKCLIEEYLIIVTHGPSYTKSYSAALQSKAYREALRQNFPNANSGLISAAPDTDFAKKIGGKAIRKRYCVDCREAEKTWFDEWNEKYRAEQAAQGATVQPPSAPTQK